MMKQIVGRKMGMTQVFATDGTMYPVTVIEVLPNVVTQKKTVEKDGYEAIQVGYEDKKENRCNKAEKGIFAKANVTPKYELRELNGDEMAKYNVGDVITADIFAAGDVVDVTGTSKGRGFAGAIKRYGYKIGPKGHGSGYHRGSGSFATIGRTNNRVHPGKKAAGHHGNKSATILNLVVVAVDASKNALLVKGAIPGPTKSIVTVRSAIKAQKGAKVIKTLVNNTEAVAE
ncbi:MAG: 50S ribosomal protein L3 [Erysipelotrichaceae bacterium]|nr:50S ribosomal protein L3 [Erysipelotrichaceae bacterium]